MNALPVLLLSVRMAVESLIRSAFPKWWTTIDGFETLEKIDLMIEQLFDPNGFHSHITPLESTSEVCACNSLLLNEPSMRAHACADTLIHQHV